MFEEMIIVQWRRILFCQQKSIFPGEENECPLSLPNLVTAFSVCFLSFILHPCMVCICLCACLLFIYRITAQQLLLPFISFLNLLFSWIVLAIKPRKGYEADKEVQLEYHVFTALRTLGWFQRVLENL